MSTADIKPTTYPALLRDRSFHSFLWTQFFGAFNDSVYKMIVSIGAVEFAAGQAQGARYLAIAGAVFVMPFILFAGYAGQIADRYSKTRVLQVTKAFEIVIMLAGAWALKARSIHWLLAVLFLLALQATLFSPAKYGIVPEMLDEAAISRANGLLEFSTFAAIVLGSSVGAFLFAKWSHRPWLMGGTLLAIAVVGSFTSLFIRCLPASGSRVPFRVNPFAEIRQGSMEIGRSRSLWLAVAGNTYFWFAGALVQLAVILLGQETLHLNGARTGLLITALAAGIGAGSMAAGSLSGPHIELGLIPVGGVLLSVFSIAIGAVHSPALAVFGLAGAGFAGGLFIVPLSAWLQEAAEPQEKGRLLATNGFWNSLGIVAASALLWTLHDLLHASASQVFVLLGVLTALVSGCTIRLLAAQTLRLTASWIAKLFFRVKVVGAGNLPKSGGALIVANHVSYVDAVLISCISPRLVRFLMFAPLCRNRFLNPVCRLFRTIPLVQDSPREAAGALRQARAALNAGDVVGIFPEGCLTETGHVQGFERGVEAIAHGIKTTPIIPIYLEGLWGHAASRKGGRAFRSFPRLRHRVTIVIGEPLFAATIEEMRARILELGTRAAAEHCPADATLGHQFIQQAKRHWLAPAIADSTDKRMSYGETLVNAMLMSRMAQREVKGERIGILTAPSVEGAIANVAIALAGKTAVNLNFTAGSDQIRQAIEISQISTVFATRELAAKVDVSGMARTVVIDEVLAGFTAGQKLAMSIECRLLPVRFLAPKAQAHDVAAIIFSSGSTGTPKGVMLSHWNLIANTDAAAGIYPVSRGDCILGVLPFFHSFGYAYTIWFPLLHGYRAVYHANPADARVIGELAARYKAAFFLSTPTFCLSYLRRCTREQFSSVRCFVVGAENLRPSLAAAFEEKLGIRLLEGYGCTEMGPVVSASTPDACEPGTAGRLLPNVSARIVNPETMEPVQAGKTGLLLVNGPGRMLGYINDRVRTMQSLCDGYYVTGDLAFIDENGFLHIADRLARFSKIAGEMVPHGKIEEALAGAAGIGRIAVTGIPDERRGERLAVLYANPDISAEEMITQLRNAGLPALWIPKADCFRKVDAIPMLGTGKVDLSKVRRMAMEMEAAAA